MKIFILFFTLLVIAFSCKDAQKEKELELKERELILKEKELTFKDSQLKSNAVPVSIPNMTANVPTAKFIYVVFKVKEPKLFHSEGAMDGSYEDLDLLQHEDLIYTSDITEIPSYSEDKQYEYIDKNQKILQKQLEKIDINFQMDVVSKVRDNDKAREMKDEKSKLVDRKIRVFNSYKEASISKNQNQGKFD